MTTQQVLLCLLFSSCSAISMFGCVTTAHKAEVAELRAAYAIHQSNLTCDQANQFSYRAVERLGYRISAFTPAAPGGTGTLTGVRASELGEEPVSVKITCATDGIHVDANAESPLDIAAEKALPLSSTHPVSDGTISGVAPARVYFRQAFYAYFMAMMEAAARGEAAQPQGQMRVTLKPLVGLETTLEFGKVVTDVLVVRVEIVNTTSNTYLFETDTIVLRTSKGARVKSLPPDHLGLPVPSLSRQQLAPGVNLKGYLYYPPGAYTGARGYLVDEESQEQEGFDIQF